MTLGKTTWKYNSLWEKQLGMNLTQVDMTNYYFRQAQLSIKESYFTLHHICNFPLRKCLWQKSLLFILLFYDVLLLFFDRLHLLQVGKYSLSNGLQHYHRLETFTTRTNASSPSTNSMTLPKTIVHEEFSHLLLRQLC